MSSRLAMLKHRARGSVPPRAKPTLRRALDLVDPVVVARYRLQSGDRAPMPRRSMRARIGEADPARFAAVGTDVATTLDEASSEFGLTPSTAGQVLDFGCGCGRVARAVLERRNRSQGLTGCDVDRQAIAWLEKRLGTRARFVTNNFSPPLPFGDAEFDLIYSISIFSHLSREMQNAWLEELKRVMRPGGLCLLSTHGSHAYDHARHYMPGMSDDLRGRLAAYASLDEEAFVFEPYNVASQDRRELPGVVGRHYGLTFQNDDDIEAQWGRVLDVVSVRPRLIRGWQDLVILRRRTERQ